MRNTIILLALAGILLYAAAPVPAQESGPIAVLKSDAPFEEKAEACRALVIKGGADAIPALAPLLRDERLSHMARLALETMPYPEAGAALRAALQETRGTLQAGIISSLGERRDEQAAPALIALLPATDIVVSQAAAEALGNIGTLEAAQALDAAIGQGGMPVGKLRIYCAALLECAEKMTAQGQREQAAAVYDRLRALDNPPPEVPAGALRGAILTRGMEEGLALLTEALRGDNEDLFAVALRIAREMEGGDAVTKGLADVLPSLPVERKARLIEALACRGGDAAGSALMNEAKEGPVEVRVAALRALARVGYAPALDLAEQLIWSEDAALATVAQDTLSYFPGEAGDARLTALLRSDKVEARKLAIDLIGRGGLHEPVDLLMSTAKSDADEGVRVAALQALRTHAGMDQVAALLEQVLAAAAQPEREAAESALQALCTRQKRAPTGDIVIQEAAYGDLPDGPSANVTEKIAQLVASGATSVVASNGLAGDTAPGVVKRLRVTYTLDGVATTKTAAEGETLVFATPAAPAALVDAFVSAFDVAQGEAKLAMLRLLGATGSPKAFEVVMNTARGEGALQDAALREICEWPVFDAFPTVMELAATSTDARVKLLARRGAVRLLREGPIGNGERLRHYALLMEQSESDDDRKLVLSGLSDVPLADAFDLALQQYGNEAVRAESVQAAIAIARKLGAAPREDASIVATEGLPGWTGHKDFWRFEDGALTGHSDAQIPRSEFIWFNGEVRDFYLAFDVRLEPNTANSGVQFRSQKIDEHGQALGYQADIGQDVWGRLYHEHGRGKLFWLDRAEKAVKPGEWNRYEILAVGPAIWTAINGTLGVACVDPSGERAGNIAVQLHAGPPQTVSYRFATLIHDPEIALAGLNAEQLVSELRAPGQE
ncbi:MAG: DUF1080 domain-containing protein [Candidatus Hydrogenedentes bacterium]|nr:DUF1080 domain-containing protein [Candidatus Hydrogenedentota bacterium]